MFQFGRCPPPCLFDSARGATPYRVAGCPIRRSSDHGLVPAPRRLSQLPTSFFGTRRQGIHRMLVLPSSSVPRLTKQPVLIAWMRIHSPSPCTLSSLGASPDTLQEAAIFSCSLDQGRPSSTVHVAVKPASISRPRSRTRRDVSSVVKVHALIPAVGTAQGRG